MPDRSDIEADCEPKITTVHIDFKVGDEWADADGHEWVIVDSQVRGGVTEIVLQRTLAHVADPFDMARQWRKIEESNPS